VNVLIARPIPMKRELKGSFFSTCSKKRDSEYCKAHPDEKGTERSPHLPFYIPPNLKIARPIPMKRELKVHLGLDLLAGLFPNCKAHPDEKGTERG